MKKKMEINLTNLKKIRKGKGITIKDVSNEIGICMAYYCQIENGKRNLSYKNAIAIANKFDMTPDELFLVESK